MFLSSNRNKLLVTWPTLAIRHAMLVAKIKAIRNISNEYAYFLLTKQMI